MVQALRAAKRQNDCPAVVVETHTPSSPDPTFLNLLCAVRLTEIRLKSGGPRTDHIDLQRDRSLFGRGVWISTSSVFAAPATAGDGASVITSDGLAGGEADGVARTTRSPR